MKSKEKTTEEIVLIRYYNVLFYLFHLRPNLFIEKISRLKLICGTYIHMEDLRLIR